MAKTMKLNTRNQRLLNDQYRQLQGAKGVFELAMTNLRLAENAMENVLNTACGEGEWGSFEHDGVKVVVTGNEQPAAPTE